jgi:hypothetical protein
MVDLLNNIAPFVPGLFVAAFVAANIRARRRHNRALREIRAGFEETERRLEALGWTRPAREAEEER